MKRSSLVLGCLLGVAAPAVADDLGKNFEASMVVTGTITVNPDGRVGSYALDQSSRLSPMVLKMVDTTVPNWRFRPVLANGLAVPARSEMSLRIVAHLINEQQATLRISGAEFGRNAVQSQNSAECANHACLSEDKVVLPNFPARALQEQTGGTVYMVIEVNHQGLVARAAVQQVNMTYRGRSAPIIRDALAANSLAAVQTWTFSVPTSGEEAKRDYWIVRVPINFEFGLMGKKTTEYGRWESYFPGPKQDIPWARNGDGAVGLSDSVDALPGNNEPFVADTRFVLLTPPSPG